MEKSNYLNTEENDVNLFKYSDVDLVNFIKEKNKGNSIMLSQEFQNKNEFLVELAIFLEKKLNHNIALYQNGFKVYKQKLFADKCFIQNNLSDDLKNLKINQLIELLENTKNNNTEKVNEYFNIGRYIKNNYDTQNNENINNNKYLFNNNFGLMKNQNININSNKNVKGINSKNKFIHGLNIKEVYHSPSPIFTNKIQSKILKENENINNRIDFNEEQNIINN